MKSDEQKILSYLSSQLMSKGIRTTEMDLIALHTGMYSHDVRDVVKSLLERRVLETLTEKQRQDANGEWYGTYCWLVPTGTAHENLIPCTPFDL